MKIVFLIVSVLPVLVFGQIPMSGSIVTHVDSLVDAMPTDAAADTGKYQIPSALQIDTWGNTIAALLNGSYDEADDSAAAVSYRLVKFTETSVTPSPVYYILEKTAAGGNYWGTFILNPSPVRRRLFIQSPHPKYDSNTGQQGAQIFRTAGARAFYVSGTHRCNSGIPTSCSGTSGVCGGEYKMSDQAHVVNGPLYRATVQVNTFDGQTIVVQNHGFGKGDGDPDVIMGNGKSTPPSGTDWLVAVRDELAAIDNTLAFKVAHIDSWTELIGTTNTQGRYINGSGNPCSSSPAGANGRFLHIEQAKPKLRETESDRQKLADAVAAAFPADTIVYSAASGNWNSPSTWEEGVVPDSSLHVQIQSGHTVTVDAAGAQCRSLMYADSTGHLVLSPSPAMLSVYGDYVPFSTAHKSFLGWADGAALRFAGTAAVQTMKNIRNNNTETNMSFFKYVRIDKGSGTVTVAGSSDSKLNIEDSLVIVNGGFTLPADYDLNGRTMYGATDAYPAITVYSGGTLTLNGGTTQVMTRPSLGRIGTMTIHGTVTLSSSSSNKINISGIAVECGGELVIGTIAAGYLNPETITVKSGGTVVLSTTNNVWDATAAVNLNAGAEYRVTTSTTHFPPSFTNHGTVNYNRTAGDGSQSVADMDYASLRIASPGIKSWNLSSGRTITDTLEMLDGTLTLVSAGQHLGVNGLLKLTADTIVTGTNIVSLGSSASVPGELAYASGIIAGNFRRWFAASTVDSALFPVGNALMLRPAAVSFTSAPASGGSLLVSFTETSPGTDGLPLNDAGTPVVLTGGDGYWSIAAENGLSGGTYSLALSLDGTEGISDHTTLRILKRSPGGAWTLDGTHAPGVGSNASPTVRRTRMSGFSEFAVGAAADNPLPAEIVDFRGSVRRRSAELTWMTAAETKNHGFEVERKTGGTDWTAIGFVGGAGSSNTPRFYSYVDASVSGAVTYRLKQIDRNGACVYSGEVGLTVGEAPRVLQLFPNYPNPFNPATTIEYSVPSDGEASVEVYNTVGQCVALLFRGNVAAGFVQQVRFDASALPSGMYFVRLSAGGKATTGKILLIK